MQKDLSLGLLNGIYKSLLTARQHEIISQYYDCDYSLQEISDNLSISRQAVLDAIKKGCETLKKLESELHLYEIKNGLSSAMQEMDGGNDTKAKEIMQGLYDAIKE